MTKLPRHMRHISDGEEAEIQRKIASDPEAPEATDEELAQARPFAEVFPRPSREHQERVSPVKGNDNDGAS